MARRFHTLMILLAMALMAFAGAGCVEPLLPYDAQTDPNAVMLPVRIYVPMDAIATKADPGDTPASEAEVTLHDLQVWAFTHQTAGSTAGDAEAAVAYLGAPSLNFVPTLGGGQILEVNLFFPSYVFRRSDEALKFDFYVLGNGNAIGFGQTDASRHLTRGELKAKTFGNSDGRGFGTGTTPVLGVPREGLPYSCFFNNEGNGFDLSFVKQEFTSAQMAYMKNHHGLAYDIYDQAFMALDFTNAQKAYITTHLLDAGNKWNWTVLCPQMNISRAVSKIRFVFAKSTGMLGTGVVSIELIDDKGTSATTDDTGVIPDASYVFPREVPSSSGIDLPAGIDYSILSMGSSEKTLVKDLEIKEDDNPLRLMSTSGVIDARYQKSPSEMTALEYEAFLSRWVGDKVSTEKVVYLRESDLPIQGRITYKYDGNVVQEPVTFSMESLPETNLYRNHSWTVYAYYSILQQKLDVTTVVRDWEGKNTENVPSIQTVNVDQDGKFFVDPSLLGFGQMDTIMVEKNGRLKESAYEVHVPATNAAPDHAQGRIAIYGPEGGYLRVKVNGNTQADIDAFRVEMEAKTGVTSSITATPDQGIAIDRTRDGGRIYVNVYRSTDDPAIAKPESKISLSFYIRLSDGREIDADSEIVDDPFYFVIRNSEGGKIYP